MEVRLYTKKQCPLCDEAKQILIDLQADYPALEIKEIDIETSDHLIEQFSLMIPVVEIKRRNCSVWKSRLYHNQ